MGAILARALVRLSRIYITDTPLGLLAVAKFALTLFLAGLAMTLGIFIPALVLPIYLHRQLVAIANDERLRPFLLGVAAGVIGLIAANTVRILDPSVVDFPTALLAIGGSWP